MSKRSRREQCSSSNDDDLLIAQKAAFACAFHVWLLPPLIGQDNEDARMHEYPDRLANLQKSVDAAQTPVSQISDELLLVVPEPVTVGGVTAATAHEAAIKLAYRSLDNIWEAVDPEERRSAIEGRSEANYLQGFFEQLKSPLSVLYLESLWPQLFAALLGLPEFDYSWLVAKLRRETALAIERRSKLRSRENAVKSNGQAPNQGRVKIKRDLCIVVLDGTPFDITPRQAQILATLYKARGRWVRPGKLKNTDESRPDKIVAQLHRRILALLDREPGRGMRFKPSLFGRAGQARP